MHACWDRRCIQKIKDEQNGSNLLQPDLLLNASCAGKWQHEAIETLLKVKEIPLKTGFSYTDTDGNTRGWEVFNQNDHPITKPFRTRAQAESFAEPLDYFRVLTCIVGVGI